MASLCRGPRELTKDGDEVGHLGRDRDAVPGSGEGGLEAFLERKIRVNSLVRKHI
jgi:hypothetical protein